jgi:hypothetical protein
MKKILLVLVLWWHVSSAQNFPITWGPLERSNGYLIDILPKNDLDFNTLRWTGGSSFGSYRLVSYENLSAIQQEKLKLVTETGLCNFVDALSFGKGTVVFLSDRMKSSMMLYAQYYDEALGMNASKFLAEYENPKFDAKPNFTIIPSQNRKFVGIIWELEGKGINNDFYGYKIINDSLQVVNEGEYNVPFDGNLSTINDHHISNTGDYFICLTEHNKANDRMFTRSFENFKALHVYKANGKELNEFTIDLQGKRVDDLVMSSNEQGAFALTGIYGTGNKNGMEGIFSIQIDPNNNALNAQSFIPFGNELVKESWNTRQQDRFSSNGTWNDPNNFNNPGTFNSRDNIGPQLYDYRMRDFFTLADGSMVGSMEQYFVFQRTTYDGRTSFTTTVNYYYYDDIIAFRISKDGQMLWQKRIPKSQVSTNDYGEFSSYCSFQSEKSLNFIFNDHLKNYDESGNYDRTGENYYSFNLSKKNNAVSLVKIDLETGNITREMMETRKDLDAIVVPKQCRVDHLNKNILIYSIAGSQERFGILNYK